MSDENNVVRAGCYLRISSDPGDKRSGVDRQREDTAVLCEAKGWTVVDYYEDNSVSASSGQQRPEWDRLLADIRGGRIDAIAAADQDRQWRLVHELESLRTFFGSLGRQVRLATTGQGDVDLYSPTGVLTAQIKTAVSEHEIAMMKVRMRRAARQRAERGIPAWRNAFGYVSGEHTAECGPKCKRPHHRLDPVTAPMVERVYRDVLAGGSITDAACWLNAQGAVGLTGKPWTPSTLSLFLRAPRNAALRAHNDIIVDGVKGDWPPLVSESVWRAAQSKMNAQTRTVETKRGPRKVRRPGAKSVRRHLLTGVLQCGKPDCGGYLIATWVMRRDNDRHISYSCRDCRGVSIAAQHVEPMVRGFIARKLAGDDAKDLLRREIHDAAEAEALRTERATLLAELEQIGVERGQRLLTGLQAKAATDVITDQLAAIDRREHDAERLRVLADIPLGQPEAVAAVEQLSPDRLRAVLAVLATVAVLPVGSRRQPGRERFDPTRVQFTPV